MATPFNKTWSADLQFIQELTILKRWFMDAGITENVPAMVQALKYLLMITEPKMIKQKPEVELERVKWAEKNLYSIQYYNAEGQAVETDGTRANKKILMSFLEETFRNTLKKLQESGVYTRTGIDMKESLGDFSDS